MLGACTAYDLLETPIIGTTDQERDLIVAELLALSEGPGGDVVLRRIEVDPDLPEHAEAAGTYGRARKVIRLAPESQIGDRFPTVVRHELCHAFDRQNGHVGADLGLHDLDDAPGLSPTTYRRKNRRAGEHFAQWCELGAYKGQLLTHTPGMPPDTRAAIEAVVRSVWVGWLPEAELPLIERHRRVSDLGEVTHALVAAEDGDIVVFGKEEVERVPTFFSTAPTGWHCINGAPLPDGSTPLHGCATRRGQIAYDYAPYEFGTLLVHTGDGWAVSPSEEWHPRARWFAGPDERILGAFIDHEQEPAELVVVEYTGSGPSRPR